MLRASMARPKNSSTSSSGFMASCAPRLLKDERRRDMQNRLNLFFLFLPSLHFRFQKTEDTHLSLLEVSSMPCEKETVKISGRKERENNTSVMQSGWQRGRRRTGRRRQSTEEGAGCGRHREKQETWGLTICRKTLESLVLEKDRSGTQRGIRASLEFARARCIFAIMAFSSFCREEKRCTEQRAASFISDSFSKERVAFFLSIFHANAIDSTIQKLGASLFTACSTKR